MGDKNEIKERRAVQRSVSENRIQNGGTRAKKASQSSGNKKGSKPGRQGKYKKGEMRKFSVTEDLPGQIICSGCQEVFDSDEVMLIECERCSNWYCINCVNMEQTEYNLMVKRKDLHWFCSSCEQQALTAVQIDMDIESKCSKYMESVTKRIEDIELSLASKCDISVTEKLAERCSKLESFVFENDNVPKPDVSNKIEESVASAVREQKDIESRKCNIVFHNLEELESDDVQERIEYDKEKVLEICEDLGIESESNNIVKINRLRKINDNKSRLLRVSFDKSSIKKSVLEKAPKIREFAEKYGPVFLSPDLTKKQRILQKSLREELKEKKESGESNWTIKNWKLVKKPAAENASDNFRSSQQKK